MQSVFTRRLVRVLMLTAGSVLCGAAGGQIGIVEGVTPLTPQTSLAGSGLVQRVMANSASLQAAPMPDQDAAAPADATQAETSVGPKFISPRSLFQGDGFSRASSAEASLDGRRTAAAGLGLSVPLEDSK